MRPIKTHEYHTAGSETKQIRATIDLRNVAHVMNQMSDLYRNLPLALIREYSTNAWDSHVTAGVTRPIEVRLPDATSDNPVFEVQDFGVGMSMTDLEETYLSYGASDKQNSDLVTGWLGFGSKAGSAYAPLGWNVTAIQNGHKIMTTVAKDAEGVPVMHVLWEGPTTEDNGVTISIPVDPDDVYDFHKEAKDFFSYWDPGTVLVDGVEPESILHEEGVIWIEEDSLAVRPRGHFSVIIMGNVPYPVHRKTEWGHAVIAKVPMGSVEHTPSRESLKMTDLTEDTLDTVFDFANHFDEDAMVKQLLEIESPWKRLVLFSQVHDSLDYHQQRKYLTLVDKHLPKRWAEFERAFVYQPHKSKNAVAVTNKVGASTFNPRWEYRHDQTGVITGYPYTKVAAIASTRRHHLKEFAAFNNLSTIVVVPGALADFPYLDGWEGATATWDEIVEAFPQPKRVRGAGRVKTSYARWMAGLTNGFLEEDEWSPADGIILYAEENMAAYWSRRFPQAQVAALRSNQINKFTRLNPTAKHASKYQVERREELRGLITEEIKMARWAGRWSWLAEHVNEIDDEDIKAAVRIIESMKNGSKDALLQEMVRLEVDIPMPQRLLDLETRYPLLNELYDWKRERMLPEVFLYMNAKWGEIQVQKVVDEIMDALESIESINADVDDADVV